MYILVVGYPNGSVEYYGPFKSQARAEEYALSLPTNRPNRWHVATIITTFHGG